MNCKNEHNQLFKKNIYHDKSDAFVKILPLSFTTGYPASKLELCTQFNVNRIWLSIVLGLQLENLHENTHSDLFKVEVIKVEDIKSCKTIEDLN